MIYGTSEQFREYDQLLIKNKNLLIENMVAEAAKALIKYIDKNKTVIIFCGKGNNGADGLALATLLKENVLIYLLGNEDELSYASQHYYKKVQTLNIPVKKNNEEMQQDIKNSDIIIDGIFGTGFKGSLSEDIDTIVSMINNYKNIKQIISIDIPSGLDANLGTVENNAIEADLTISFMAKKIGFLNPNSLKYTGRIFVEDILYDDELFTKIGFSKLLDNKDIECLLKNRIYNGYKGSYGLLSCYVGSKDYPGAALISVGAALNTGCGLVQIKAEDRIKEMIVQRYPEVILCDQVNSYDAILFGCGKGWNEQTKEQLHLLLTTNEKPMLIDADGLNCLSENLEVLKEKKCQIVLTPHIGEMRRLNDRPSTIAAIEFCRQYDVVIVLKGPNTMVTDGYRCVRIPSGNKAMAVAGMGDCLAGIISALLAQHYDIFDASVLGTYIHGLCGDEIAKNNYTVLPTKIITIISQIMNKINNKNQVQ